MKKSYEKVKSVLTWFILITYPLIAVFLYFMMAVGFCLD